MRVSLIDEDEAHPRPELARGFMYRPDLNAVLDALTTGRATRITARQVMYTDQQDDIRIETNFVRSVLLETAAARGEQVEVWQGDDGFVYLQTASRA